jgi:hypothetical protein
MGTAFARDGARGVFIFRDQHPLAMQGGGSGTPRGVRGAGGEVDYGGLGHRGNDSAKADWRVSVYNLPKFLPLDFNVFLGGTMSRGNDQPRFFKISPSMENNPILSYSHTQEISNDQSCSVPDVHLVI